MKIKIIILLILSRISDLYSTYFLLGNDLITYETSPLARELNFGWLEFILANIVLVIIVGILLYYSDLNGSFNKKESEHKTKIINFESYISLIISNKKKSFLKLLLSSKINYKIYYYLSLYSFSIAFIVVGFLVTISNIVVNIYPYIYNSFSDKTLTNTARFSLVLLTFFIQYHYLKKRYLKFSKNV